MRKDKRKDNLKVIVYSIYIPDTKLSYKALD